MKVILVDDNIKALEGLEKLINWEEAGCVCAGKAANGCEALELCREIMPDIVITDIKMPMMDGLSLCERIREIMPKVHLLIITAYDEFDYAKSAVKYGVENIILKPFNQNKLQELTQCLKKISRSSRDFASSLSEYLDSDISMSLDRAMKQGESESAAAMIRGIEGLSSGDFNVVHYVAINLIDFLHLFAEGMGLRMETAREQCLAHIHGLRSKELIKDYVIELYKNVCLLVNESKSVSTEKIVARVKKHILMNFCSPDTCTTEIAERFKISQSYLCHIYKSHERVSINTYITSLRIEKATGLLRNTDLPVVSVSKQVGYNDSHYFTKVFKKMAGMTPTEYRNLYCERF